jgi:putative protein-disulfide isomerase
MSQVVPPLPRLYYFADPMCSWCYGFAPEMDQLMSEYAGKLDIRLVMGGLRPGKLAQTMTPAIGRVIKHHWHEVGKASGQAFDMAFFEREGFVYDTEPAAKAVIVIEQLAPQFAYEYYHAIQHGFYAENRDITKIEILSEYAVKYGVSGDDFATAFANPESHEQTWAQFQFSAQLGVRGFPCLIHERNATYTLVTRGYQKLAALRPVLEQMQQAALGASCEIDGDC